MILKYVQSIKRGSLCSLPNQRSELVENYDDSTDRKRKKLRFRAL